MKEIRLNCVIPEIFASRRDLHSEVWGKELSFERGKRYLIEATSGGGKSSLCSYLYGQRGDYRGEILFDGRDICNIKSDAWCDIRERHISILPQELRLFGELTALENIEIKNRLTSCRSKAEIISWFEELGIGDKLHSRTDRLSYGQQQRVVLIRALCQPFDFLLLDEPISHLDNTNSNIMREVILREVEKCGAAVISTSIGKHMDMTYDKHLHL